MPRLSDSRFESGLVAMTGEYDKEVSREKAARNPYASQRLIVKSTDRYLDPDDYGAVDAIQSRDGTYLLQFDTSARARRAEKALSKEEATEYVEPDVLLYAAEEADADAASSAPWNVCQMGIDRYASYITAKDKGRPVTVAVLDTGILFDHPMLAGRLDTQHARSFVDGFPVDEGAVEADLQSSHGTHVAGIIAQCTQGLNVKLLPVRVLNTKIADGRKSSNGSISGIISGIEYAVQQGADVINLSVAGISTSKSTKLETCIRNAVSCGVVVVVSSGNGGRNICINNGTEENPSYSLVLPAYIPECIVVGSVDRWQDLSNSSNFGETLDVVAPGVDINSSIVSSSGQQTGLMTGTSMAAPHVTAQAAVLGMVYPDSSAQQIESRIREEALDLGEPGFDLRYGCGFACLSAELRRTVTYQPGSAGTFEAICLEAEYGLPTPAPPDITCVEGYVFSGWSPAMQQRVTENVSYTAQWSPAAEGQSGSGEGTAPEEGLEDGQDPDAGDGEDADGSGQITETDNVSIETDQASSGDPHKTEGGAAETKIPEEENPQKETESSADQKNTDTTDQKKNTGTANQNKNTGTADQKKNTGTTDQKKNTGTAERTETYSGQEVQTDSSLSQDVLEESASAQTAQDIVPSAGSDGGSTQELFDELRQQETVEDVALWKNSDPQPNITGRIPLKVRQKTKVLKVTGLDGGDGVTAWKSSDTKKASVTGRFDGTCVVKAGKKTGNVQITAETASGRKITFRIKVQKNKVRTKKILTASKKPKLYVGETQPLKAELYPATSAEKIRYTSGNRRVVTVSKSGVLKAKAKGSAVITIQSGSKKIRVKVTVRVPKT